jgi:hypothetical protein
MVQPSVKITTDELEVALQYLEETTLSDFFPRPFELDAVRFSWDQIKDVLNSIDLLNYDTQDFYELTAPKGKWQVRPVKLLNPLDTILFTALSFRFAPIIQDKRNEYSDGIVFSWKYNPSRRGTKKMFESDWRGFSQKSKDLSEESEYVATSDIVDFFPRIYLHRLENTLDAISGEEYFKRALMRMLKSWSNGTSYGIPTGPHASNIIAEALLIEVDEYLISKHIEFIRHDDDYLIFGESNDCLRGLFLLGERLQKTQRLSLNSAKTNVFSSAYYINHFGPSGPPSGVRTRIINDILGGNPYADIEYDDLTDAEKQAIAEINPEEVFETELQYDIVTPSVIRVVLKVLAATPSESIVSMILDNLQSLLPVADDVAKYLHSAQNLSDSIPPDAGEVILEYLISDSFIPEFQATWLLNPFTENSQWNNLLSLRQISNENQYSYVRRQAILGLGEIGDRSSLLDHRSRFYSTSSWEQRTIIFSLRKLPEDEFNAFISFLGGTGGQWNRRNALQKAVIKYAQNS